MTIARAIAIVETFAELAALLVFCGAVALLAGLKAGAI